MKYRVESKDQYQQFYQTSMEDQNKYWEERAQTFTWFKKWDSVQTGNFKDLNVEWFSGGKLNITVNALDRHAENTPDKVAIFWEPNDPKESPIQYTYKELLEKVNQFANVLAGQGIEKGDRICFYMSMVPEFLIGVLATARIGAVHSVVFGGFSAKALAERINDCDAKLVVTNDEAYRGNKIVPLKNITDEALEKCSCVKSVLCLKRTGGNIKMQEGRDHWLNELLDLADKEFQPAEMDAEDPLFILYTSGSTGKPKGLQHTTAGYMLWASETYKNVFQVGDNDIYWCTADIGWITGHSYITYGPLLNGSTQVMFEGIPTFPDAGRFWQIVDKYRVTHFYTAPTAIRALEACDEKFVNEANLSSLKVLGTVGEPINIEAWNWYNEKIGKKNCPIVDTWWQTETGGIMISTLAGVTDVIPCHATLPLPGVCPMLVDNEGNEITSNPAEGNLCIDRPWPGMARTIYGDHERYRQTYFSTYPGKYFTGDGARRDKNGNYRITGRVDDVINVSGHRIGTAEVEDAINEHEAIVESAVIGVPHDIKGESLVAFMIPFHSDSSSQDLLTSVNELITKEIGAIAKLEKAIVVPGLPKTRSGKIMRRILRKVASGELDKLGDTSTLLNPEIVDEIIKAMK
ncbi:MAG: acetate--CoA ligase [Halobacteriovoraceae bacterium]|nr:acetate--CoA ligase [Halobacteriovoraceae bacterium]|tara:strand:+ start:11054 stop:12949 length:1896 start_codon:yes stop_codon:yes gene_type:complete